MNADLRWPVGLAIFLTLFVAFLVGFALFSSRIPVSLVSADYYQKGVSYQEQIERIQRSAALPLRLVYEPADEIYTISGFPEGSEPTSGRVKFYRPSDETQDFEIPLIVDPTGRLSVDVAALTSGVWRVKLDWRAGDETFYFESVFNKN